MSQPIAEGNQSDQPIERPGQIELCLENEQKRSYEEFERRELFHFTY